MTYFAIICSTKKFQANLEVSEVLITSVTNRGKTWVMLHIVAGYSNNCQIILKLFGCDIFCNYLKQNKISSKFGGIKGINHLCDKQAKGKAKMMLHIGAGHRINCQMILILFRYDICCSNLQHKKFQAKVMLGLPRFPLILLFMKSKGANFA